MANHNMYLVVLSYVVSVIGSLGALITVREALREDTDDRGELIFAAALCLGIIGVWSMHFIGMLAFSMPNMNMSFNWLLTALSLVVAVAVVYMGLAFIAAGEYSLGKLVLAGIFVGLGVAAMHYTGMLAMLVQADVQWDMNVIAVSVFIAVNASIVALWLATHVQHLWQIVISALVMGVAICGMHYTGMTAVSFIHNPNLPPVEAMDVGVVAFSLIIVALDVIVLVVAMAIVGANRNELVYRK
jgi:NO-binding membrane sensor protein with MHYT domain